jgi:hypothetical protein
MPRTVALTWNLNTGRLVADDIYLKRNEKVVFELTCLEDDVATLLVGTPDIILTVKQRGVFDGDPLLLVTDWTPEGTTYTSAETLVSSTQIDTLLHNDDDSLNDVPSAICSIDIREVVAAVVESVSDTATFLLKNSVGSQSDGIPSPSVTQAQALANLGITLTNDEFRIVCPDGTTRRALLSDL